MRYGKERPGGDGADAGNERIEALITRMTLTEKAGQLSQLPLSSEQTPAATLDAVRAGRVGSFLNAFSLEQRNQLQRAAVEENHLGIPLIFGRDVIHGYKTIFPIPLGQSASFDPGLVERAASVAAREAYEGGIDWVFAPMVDIARDPRWGRIAEGCGEDPYLASLLGAAMVRGFQGTNLGPGRVAACAKHFAGYGATEAGREYNTTWIPEQLLRELYLVPFRACVDAGALTIMSAFNDLNGVPPTGNELLLRRILRDEWGFAGFVVSDWNSVIEMISHGLVEDGAHAAGVAIRAGCDMEMASDAYLASLPRLVDEGSVPVKLVDDAVRRVLAVKQRLGLFERPYASAPEKAMTLSEAHLGVAREVARASLVLLKNEGGLLPLGSHVKSIALIGALADDQKDQLGCWSFDGDAKASRTILAALRERCGPATAIHVARGVADCRSSDTSGFAAALDAARASEVVVAAVGEGANLSGEAHSRAFLDLPGVQQALLEKLAETGRPLVVVYMAGRPLTIGASCALARAAVYAWHPGTMAGPAIVDVLFGDEAPSGKLPVSFPRTVGQVPIYYNAKNTGRPATASARGIPPGTPLDPVGFESSYLDVDPTPEFPFGFGLSYTTFAYSDLRVSPAAKVGDPIHVAFRLKNTGPVTGVEVAQLYIRDRVASVTRPVRELKRFERVQLAAGEEREISFTLGAHDLQFIGRDLRPHVEPGAFDVFVGGDSRASLQATFILE